jgi:hypothetical protein
MSFLRSLAFVFGIALISLAMVALLFLFMASPLGLIWGGVVWFVLLLVGLAFVMRNTF